MVPNGRHFSSHVDGFSSLGAALGPRYPKTAQELILEVFGKLPLVDLGPNFVDLELFSLISDGF